MNRLSRMTIVLATLGLAACGSDSLTGPTRSAGLGGGDATAPASLVVQVVTTGGAFDRDGYTLSIDGRFYDVPTNLDRMSVEIEAGPHALWLSGVAANCEVQGTNPRQLSIDAGDRTKVSLEVVCFG